MQQPVPAPQHPAISSVTVDLGPLLESVRDLAWLSRRRAIGSLPGAHRSRLRGSAPELSEYRLYRQGDEPRQLDWKLLARSDRAYIRLAEETAILPTWFVVDASESMAFPQPGHDKARLAAALVVALASLAVAAGDPVGLIVVAGSNIVRLPARARRSAVHDLASALAAVAPGGRAPLAAAVRDLRPGTRLVFVSDFLGDEADLRRLARGLSAAGSDIHAVHIVAAEELAPPRRVARAIDPEDDAIARPLDPERLAAYDARFGEWRATLAHEWRNAGAQYTMVTTGDDPARAVRKIVSVAPAAAEPVRPA